jgi:hypothetical protein
MDDTTSRLAQARDLIKARRFNEARRLLEKIDHPQATKWLDQLDLVAPVSGPAASPAAMMGNDPFSGDGHGLPFTGILLGLVVALVGGAAVGVALFFSSTITYLICISPLIAGGAAGALLSGAMHIGRVRDGMAAVLFGLLMGAALYGGYRYTEYWDFRNDVADVAREEEPSATDEEISIGIDLILEEETGSTGFIGFTKYSAKQGMSITWNSRYSSNDGADTTFGERETVIYWVVELLLVMAVPIGMALNRTDHPYCHDVDNWLKFEDLGRVSREDMDAFLRAYENRDYFNARNLLTQNRKLKPALKVEVGRCGPQSGTAMARLTVVQKDSRNNKVLTVEKVPVQAYSDLSR